jgi:MraZ protein
MFLGQHSNTIDEKGRITLPSRFRELLSDGAYITAGLDQNLIVMPASHFNQQYDRINAMNPNNPLVRKYRRFTFGRASKIEFDSVGRFIIPQNLRESANLTNSAIIVGIGEDIEIWSPNLWNEQDKIMEDPENSTSGFENLDLSNS